MMSLCIKCLRSKSKRISTFLKAHSMCYGIGILRKCLRRSSICRTGSNRSEAKGQKGVREKDRGSPQPSGWCARSINVICYTFIYWALIIAPTNQAQSSAVRLQLANTSLLVATVICTAQQPILFNVVYLHIHMYFIEFSTLPMRYYVKRLTYLFHKNGSREYVVGLVTTIFIKSKSAQFYFKKWPWDFSLTYYLQSLQLSEFYSSRYDNEKVYSCQKFNFVHRTIQLDLFCYHLLLYLKPNQI